MPSAERTIAIRRPVDQVFRFLSDGRTATQWRSGVIEVSKASGDGVGAVYRQVVRGPGGRPVDADYEITALEPDARIAFRAIAGPVRPTGGQAGAESAARAERARVQCAPSTCGPLVPVSASARSTTVWPRRWRTPTVPDRRSAGRENS